MTNSLTMTGYSMTRSVAISAHYSAIAINAASDFWANEIEANALGADVAQALEGWSEFLDRWQKTSDDLRVLLSCLLAPLALLLWAGFLVAGRWSARHCGRTWRYWLQDAEERAFLELGSWNWVTVTQGLQRVARYAIRFSQLMLRGLDVAVGTALCVR